MRWAGHLVGINEGRLPNIYEIVNREAAGRRGRSGGEDIRTVQEEVGGGGGGGGPATEKSA